MLKRIVLVVEDEDAIRELVGFTLDRAGYEMHEAEDAEQAWRQVNNHSPNLILLDWMLPGMSGIELARRLRRNARTVGIPIIMLTARGDEHDKVYGLEAGADDYLSKPFSPRELIARIGAVLRRVGAVSEGEVYELNGLCLNRAEHRVTSHGNPLNLGPTEFRLLHFFLSHPGRVYSRGQILDYVWGSNVYIEERTVDVHIRRLRKALSPNDHHRMIETIRGVGYRFSARD
jgi:two-component system phosphate regulon response regulator PhoB